MPTNAPGRFWIIRSPSNTGAVVAKFDTAGETRIPDEIADYNDFVISQVADRSAVASETVDHTGLTDDEKDRLRAVYPVD